MNVTHSFFHSDLDISRKLKTADFNFTRTVLKEAIMCKKVRAIPQLMMSALTSCIIQLMLWPGCIGTVEVQCFDGKMSAGQ